MSRRSARLRRLRRHRAAIWTRPRNTAILLSHLTRAWRTRWRRWWPVSLFPFLSGGGARGGGEADAAFRCLARAMALGLRPRRRISWFIASALAAMVGLQAAAAFLVFYVLVTVFLLVLTLCILSAAHLLPTTDLPPAKRRRTLAGSIVSTAVSAALIGTAVGLTVYRL